MNISSWIGRTPGHCATMSSICIWKMSWLILSPKGTRRNQYLPRCMLNVVSNDACSVICILKNALFPSTFENFVAPVNSWAIFSRVSALCFSLMIALFRSLGLGQILNLLFGFFGYVSKLTHGVGSVCFTMIPCQTMSFNSFSISALGSMGTLYLPCCTGGTHGSILMSYSPDMSLIWSKMFGYRVCKSFVLFIWMLPGST